MCREEIRSSWYLWCNLTNLLYIVLIYSRSFLPHKKIKTEQKNLSIVPEEKEILLFIILFSSFIDNEEKNKAFYNMFYLHSSSIVILCTYLLICTLFLFLYDRHMTGFFVQVYDRAAYIKIHLNFIVWQRSTTNWKTFYYQNIWEYLPIRATIYLNVSIKSDTNTRLQSVNMTQLSVKAKKKKRKAVAILIEVHLSKWTVRHVVQSEHALHIEVNSTGKDCGKKG
jgi:hypothetical protein